MALIGTTLSSYFKSQHQGLLLAIVVSMLFLLVGFALELVWLGLIFPIILIGAYLLTFEIRVLYTVLFLLVPWSMELLLPGGLGTDIPTEPMLWIFSVIALFYLLFDKIPRSLFIPIGGLIVAQLIWLIITTLNAHHMATAFKYSLAKIWYILPFFVLPFYIIKKKRSLIQLMDWYLLGLLSAALYFFISHLSMDLDFMAKTSAGKPFWRNHVNYACALVSALPIIWYRRKTCSEPHKWKYSLLFIVFLIFMYFSYARVVYLCLAVSAVYVMVLHLGITRWAIIVALGCMSFLAYDNLKEASYLRLAPEFTQAVTQQSFDKKINATLEGKDISTMERLHRWVAGIQMIKENPITGVGPSNFYQTYKTYAINSFETYVSDNPEKSGIHNYYLMLLVEQGFLGLLLFLITAFTALLRVEQVYHTSKVSVRQLMMMTGTIIIIILTLNTINDMIEVIKIGAWFFFALFIAANGKNILEPIQEK